MVPEPFFLLREEEGLDGLKGLQWELPLQDGRSLLGQAGGTGSGGPGLP